MPAKVQAACCEAAGSCSVESWFINAAGSEQISIEEPKMFAWNSGASTVWDQNRKCAERAEAKLNKSIQDLNCHLNKIQLSISTVTYEEVVHDATQRAKSLCTLSYDVLMEFNQWRNFQLNEAELMDLKRLAETCGDRPASLLACTDKLQK